MNRYNTAETKSNDSAEDAALIREFLSSGVPLNRITDLFAGRINDKEINNIARKVVIESPTPGVELGVLVLERSKSASLDTQFLEKHIKNLTSDAPEELIDPLFLTIMQYPVVTSSGYVYDKSTVLNEKGDLKFRRCPFTRESLKKDVFPLVDRKAKLNDFKKTRCGAMVKTAESLLAEKNFVHFNQVIAVAEKFLDDIGIETYAHLSRQLAELRLKAGEISGQPLPPSELAKVYIRIHRTMSSSEIATDFFEKVEGLKLNASKAFDEDRLEEAVVWCDACEAVLKACSINVSVSRIRLEVARKKGEDLTLPRLIFLREIQSDQEALNRFLQEEGITMNEMEDPRLIILCKKEIINDTEDDDWHCAFQSEPLQCHVSKVMVSAAKFTDQGWGNKKTKLGLALYNSNGSLVARCDIFGTYRTEGYRYGKSPFRLLDSSEDVVSRAQPGFTYKLEFTVGGGGGHSIHVKDWFCKIFPVTWHVKGMNTSHHMADLDGDEGLYTGQCDACGKAHGLGELHYVDGDGDQFVGEFLNESPVNGCQYKGETATATMKNQRWTDTIEPEIVSRFPQNIIFHGDLTDDSDTWFLE